MIKTVKWQFEFSERARKEFKELDPSVKKRIQQFITRLISANEKPQKLGKRLSGKLGHLYSFRVGTYRILAEVYENKCYILALHIGHRREVYNV